MRAQATGGEDAVVLEPLSAMSDAFNNHDGQMYSETCTAIITYPLIPHLCRHVGLHVISAGETYTNSFGVRVV